MTERVACIGAGNVGRSWAIVFARAGFPVALYDQDAGALEAARAAIAAGLADLATPGGESVDAALARIHPTVSLDDALAGVRYVQESIHEDRAIKRAIFEMLDARAPADAILASSVSTIPASRFLEDLPGSHRCIVAHPINPPHLVPVVEVLGNASTSEETFRRCWAIMETAGQVPVRVNREITGYVVNRLQFALIREALNLVQKGYVSAPDLDKMIKHGLGRRWAFMGVFETNHLNATGGIREYYEKYGAAMISMFDDLFDEAPAIDRGAIAPIADEIERTTPIAAVPARQAWRDRALARLARDLRAVETDDETGGNAP